MGFENAKAKNAAGSILIRVAISIVLLGWLLYKTDRQDLGRAFLHVNWAMLGLALVVTYVSVALMTARWHAALAAMGARMGYLGLLQSNMVGLFFNLFTPTNVGQDAARVIDFKTGAKSTATGVASVMIDRLLGMLGMLIFAVVAFPFAAGRLHDVSVIKLAVGVTSASILIALGLLWSPAGRPVGRLATRFMPEKVKKGLRKCYDMTSQMTGRPTPLALSFGLALAFQLLVIITNYMVAQAVGVSVSLSTLMLVVPLALIVASIPISVNGVGLREWAYVNLWGAFGVSREQAIVCSLMFFALWVVMGLTGMIVYLTRRRILHAIPAQDPAAV